MREELDFTFGAGYFAADDLISVPDGGMVSPSSNVIYDKRGKPISVGVLSAVTPADGGVAHFGGNRVFALDNNLLGLMGLNTTSDKATGNMFQGIGRSLWFVGSPNTANIVRVLEDFTTLTNIGALSTTPQYCKYNGTGWNAAVQVGVSTPTAAPVATLTSSATRGGTFTGNLTGSFSWRLARKRNGAVSIATGASNILTGDGDTAYLTIPDYPEDGSAQSDRSWVLYATPLGLGSQAAHLTFPIEIAESKLDGTDATGWESSTGNARVKVISQHASDQSQRIIEVEFLSNDLLNLTPFEDYFTASACKFIAPLGNVLCLIGTGTDSTGFDVSYPNNREAFPVLWRDWFSEVPVAIAIEPDAGYFWVAGANTTYVCRWTGATQESAPVVIDRVSSKYGCVGSGAMVAVNGAVYMLSKGNIPVRFTPDGIDITFGSRVKNTLRTYDETTQLGYDPDTNSIIWACGSDMVAYQIDNDKWSSPIQVTNNDISALVNINGYLYASIYDSGYAKFRIYQYNVDGATTWKAVSPFRGGNSSLALKDIIESRLIAEGGLPPYTITVQAYKNFNLSVAYSLYSSVNNDYTNYISTRVLLESLDYDTIAVSVSGTNSGETVHLLNITVEIHEIPRTS